MCGCCTGRRIHSKACMRTRWTRHVTSTQKFEVDARDTLKGRWMVRVALLKPVLHVSYYEFVRCDDWLSDRELPGYLEKMLATLEILYPIANQRVSWDSLNNKCNTSLTRTSTTWPTFAYRRLSTVQHSRRYSSDSSNAPSSMEHNLQLNSITPRVRTAIDVLKTGSVVPRVGTNKR